MSETVPEDTGVTGEVDSSGADAAEGHPEDQEAEEQLHEVMQQEDPEELKRQLEHWRTTARRHERSARDNSAAATKWREQEEAGKSDLQKAEERAAAAEERERSATEQTNRMLAAAANNLSPDWIDFIGSGSADDINARAEQLVELIEAEVTKRLETRERETPEPRSGRRQRTGRPAEQLSGMRAGSAPADTAVMTADQMFRQLVNGDRD